MRPLITKASAIYGMGDALNERAFLVSYCRQKHIPRSSITIYTEKYWWMFEGLGFGRELVRSNFKGLTAFRNFGRYNIDKIFNLDKLDICIALNAGIRYNFDVCVALPEYQLPDIKLPEKFITINTGYGEFSGKPGEKDIVCTKSWPIHHWTEFVKKIGVPCVQIGAGPSCQPVDGVALNLIDKLSIKESAAVMRKALFHVDMEGGLPILNQHLGKKSVVLFGSTAIQNQGRSFNLNIRCSTCMPCYEWGSKRMNKLFAPKNQLPCGVRCMEEIKPDFVIDAIEKTNWLEKGAFVDEAYFEKIEEE